MSDPAPGAFLGFDWLSKASLPLSLGSPGNKTWGKSCLEVVWGKVVPESRWKEQNEQNREGGR